jgi:mono/diheme cytochrome c family protein
MRRVVATAALVWIAAAVIAAQAPGAVSRITPRAAVAKDARSGSGDAAKHRAWLNQYCVSCHGGRAPQPANDPLNLESASLDDPLKSAATWERVLRKLSVRAMPPAGVPRPQEAEYAAFTGWLADSLDRAWAGRSTPGLSVIHRLNRAEYRNAIRDLLALDVDVAAILPNDGGDFGFDNIAAALRTSPLLLDGYVTAAQRISTMAIGDPKAVPATAEFPINRNVSQNAHVDGLPLGTRGGRVVRHIFPADGEYRLFGRLVRGIEEGYAGIENDQPHTFVITVDGSEVFSSEIGGPADHEAQAKDMNAARPIIDARMTGRVMVTAGPHDVGFSFRERPFEAQDVWQPARRDSQEVHMIGGLPKLKSVGIEGPYKTSGVSTTPSRARVFSCRPKTSAEEPTCAARIVTSLARRAYRRPVTGSDTEAPLVFYRRAREEGGDFDAGIRAALARILASTSFLYRVESDPPGMPAGKAHAVTDLDLASRLSFFLWSSIPDDRLLRLASTGQLSQPAVLAAEVRRMVADARSAALVSNFAGQWLQLRNLPAKVQPDLLTFPDFDDNLRDAFRRETELVFGYILREDRSVLDLLNADYTFVDERLARHYGIRGVYGARFRRVPVTDPNRRGLLGHGSILSLTSIATRTSPVYRGKFILSTFLDTPPPPPPPVVPTLEDSTKTAGTAPKTVREQMEFHRRSPACSGCHRVIDPVGFALEHFNPVGQWRETGEEGAALDSRGTLADGTEVDSPAALREAILKRPDAFATVLTTRLMTYALGRGLEPSDMPIVRQIVRRAGREQYRFGAIIQGIVDSPPFRMRVTQESETRTQTARTQE